MFKIPYAETGYFSKLMMDYLHQKPSLRSLYHRFPTIDNFKDQIAEKQQHFNSTTREILVQSLRNQYLEFEVSTSTEENLRLLSEETTFTITTGHQLNLFTGPLYFIYKIISTIQLTKLLKKTYPEYNFVPIYWMATEDHDFEEINHFQYKDKKVQWNQTSSGPVGRLSTKDLEKVCDVFSSQLGVSLHAEQLRKWFHEAYVQHHHLAAATRYMANALFKDQGLVIIDADQTELKRVFAPYIKKELTEQLSYQKVQETLPDLAAYTVQVNPREINLFFMEDGLRERIVRKEDTYTVLNTDYTFSKDDILNLVDTSPEKFSPNVVLRPLYEEIILPNLCYIGGGGELAYWLELKTTFEAFHVPFPILLLRNSVVLATEKQQQKMEKLQLHWEDMFLPIEELQQKKILNWTHNAYDFSAQKKFLQQQFDDLKKIAQQTDPSFIGAVEAQEKKQLKGLLQLEKRWFLAEKRIHTDALHRISILKNEIFPHGGLQERHQNFSVFYESYGPKLLDVLYETLDPLEQQMNILIL